MNHQTREAVRAAWTRKLEARYWPLPQTSSSWLKRSRTWRPRPKDCMAPLVPGPNELCPCTFKPWWVEQTPYKRCCHKRTRTRRRLLARFLNERCVRSGQVSLDRLSDVFEAWLIDRGQAMPARVWLSSDLAALGWRSGCRSNGRCTPRHIPRCSLELLEGIGLRQ